jgi:ATP-binding cassette, subfamily C, bacterial
MHLMLTFFRAYPWQTLIMLLALLFAGFAEGIGLSALLPLLNIAVRTNTDNVPAEESEYERLVSTFLNENGIDPSIGVMLAIIVMASTLKNILLLVANKQVGYTAAHVATDLRLKMLSAILRSRWEYFISQPVGKITNALATEAQRSSQAFVNGSLMITFGIQTVIYGAVAVALSWQATLACLITGLLIILTANSLVRISRRAGKKQTSLLTSLAARLTDTLQSVKPLKAMGRENSANALLAAETAQLNTALQRQVLSTAVLGAVQEVLLTIAIAAGMFVALVQFEMPFTTVLVLAIVLGRMLRQFSKVQREYQKAMIGESAFWSLQSTIDQAIAKREQLDAGKTPSLKDGIRFNSVDFTYAKYTILDGLTLEIPSGSLTTLVGPSGAGKTTLIDLITGLLQPRSGNILIDNTDISELDIKTWRRMIGYVPQETHLLHDTVLHNITLGDPDLSCADVECALKAAGAWEFVTGLPEGMKSIVGERGEKLSGGQRQRIMIARALVRHPELLILDEATSALDPDSEAAILKTIERLRGKLTLLAISHQKALVDAADRVYRLENGRTVMTNDALPHAVCS